MDPNCRIAVRQIAANLWWSATFESFIQGISMAILARMVIESYVCTFIMLMTIVLAPMTLMNMLIGILCDVVSSVAASEK